MGSCPGHAAGDDEIGRAVQRWGARNAIVRRWDDRFYAESEACVAGGEGVDMV